MNTTTRTFLMSATAAGLFAGASLADVTINEIRIDQPGSDNDEYFELAGNPNESLANLWYIVVGDGAAGGGVIESVIGLDGLFIPADGFFFGAENTFTLNGATPDLTTDINFENSDNVTHFLVRDFAGANGDDLDFDDDGVLDATPWSDVLDSLALIEDPNGGDPFYGNNSLGPDGTFVPAHGFRLPNGDGAWNIGSFDPVGGFDTPGAANVPAPGAIALLGLAGFASRRRQRVA